jgi:hypothetical protein
VTADRAPRDFCDFLYIYIILPTGAMGNIVAGYNMVKKMGIPLGMLCSGVNANDITDRVMKTGKFYKSDGVKRTLSEAINVQVVCTLFLIHLNSCVDIYANNTLHIFSLVSRTTLSDFYSI